MNFANDNRTSPIVDLRESLADLVWRNRKIDLIEGYIGGAICGFLIGLLF